MGNRKGLKSGSAVKMTVNGFEVKYVTTFSVTHDSSIGYRIKVKRLYNGNSAPATDFMYAMKEFNLISCVQCEESLNGYNNRVWAKHMKRQTKGAGTKKTWTKEYRNNKFNW